MSLEIKRLRRSKLTIPQIANILKISKHKVKMITREMPDNNSITHEIKKDLGFQMFLEKLKEKFNGEILYDSGYEHSDKAVSLKCAAYNHEFKMTAQIIRHKRDTKCPECKKLETINKQEEKKLRNEKIKTTKLSTSLKEIYIKDCKYCNKTFGTLKNNNKYCSSSCKKSFSNTLKETRKRKISANGSVEKDITLPKLVIKENGICYLCGEQVDYKDFFYDVNGSFIVGRNYPSIEHVIPVSKGGTHSWDNVKLAHCYCNSVKGDR